MPQLIKTPRADITIRTAVPEDAASVFELRVEALTAHPEAFAADVDIAKARGMESWVSLINENMKDQSGVLFVADAGDELIGMTGIGRGHWPKTRHTAIVWGVYVNPAWRGLGVATAILNECITWAKEHEIVVLKLGVVTSNDAAIRCYQGCGFQIYGTEPKSSYLNGVYYDEYLMARLI